MRVAGSNLNLSSLHSLEKKLTVTESLETWKTQGSAQASEANHELNFPPKDFNLDLSSGTGDIQGAGKALAVGSSNQELSALEKMQVKLVEKFIELVTGKKIKLNLAKLNFSFRDSFNAQITQQQSTASTTTSSTQNQRLGWGASYEYHEAYMESESLSFSASGVVKTKDGQEIDISIELNLSRTFVSEKNLSIQIGDKKVDPLIVNFEGTSAELTQTKFSFDIDVDGTDNQISMATGGSGFLALDKNEDGLINDGSELFGPQTGNGFNELTQYDMDNNQWIDESDDIFNKLRIWSTNENGTQTLFALGEKGIGAIYLGNLASPFSISTPYNEEQGEIKQTGVFLKEDGGAGTIQHVDLVV